MHVLVFFNSVLVLGKKMLGKVGRKLQVSAFYQLFLQKYDEGDSKHLVYLLLGSLSLI